MSNKFPEYAEPGDFIEVRLDDIIKKAMIAVDSWCRQDPGRARLIMQVHDELVLEVHHEQVDGVRDAIRKSLASMQTAKGSS